jgi:ribonuclease HII
MGLKKYLLANRIEAGTDEAGRGCLAGPVVAAAVILPQDFEHALLNDSKQLSKKKRDLLRPVIESNALSWGVAFISEIEIDEINILKGSIKAMHNALYKLHPDPSHILVDGNKFTQFKDIPHTTIVKGDAKFMSIAAASVLAKTYRDAYMEKIHNEYPHYHWNTNKGYPTRQHRDAIREFGICQYHRKSFRLLPEQLKLDL